MNVRVFDGEEQEVWPAFRNDTKDQQPTSERFFTENTSGSTFPWRLRWLYRFIFFPFVAAIKSKHCMLLSLWLLPLVQSSHNHTGLYLDWQCWKSVFFFFAAQVPFKGFCTFTLPETQLLTSFPPATGFVSPDEAKYCCVVICWGSRSACFRAADVPNEKV